MLAQSKNTRQESDELEFACPNCGTVIGVSEARPITIGCIVRSAVRSEGGQRKALHQALSNDKSEIPPISQEAMGEIFTVSSPWYTYLPPIVQSMKLTVAEIQSKRSLMDKVVRTCASCYDRFVDDSEIARQQREELKRLRAKPARPPQRLEPIELISTARGADRRTDMAFTDLQASQRSSSRVLQNKETVRQKLIHSIGGNTDALAIDWEVVPPVAVREMRRTAKLIAQDSPRRSAAVSPSQPTHTEGGDVIFRRGRNAAPPPLNFHGIGESPVTAFDVPLEVRLMADLFAKVTNACEGFPVFGTQPVPSSHPFFSVYRHNRNRLPAPPVPHVHNEIPHPLESLPVMKQNAIPSEVKALEDTPNLLLDRRAAVRRVAKGQGWSAFTAAEMAMLAEVLADDSIVVESDEDEEDEDYETDEDYVEDWREVGGMYY